jgi:hypothetical protein
MCTAFNGRQSEGNQFIKKSESSKNITKKHDVGKRKPYKHYECFANIFLLFIYKTCKTKWQTVENADISIISTLLKT